MSGTKITVLAIVYIVILLLIYVSYMIGISKANISSDWYIVFWISLMISFVLFITTATLHIIEYKIAAIFTLIMSIIADVFTSTSMGIIDTTKKNNASLGYVIISPFIYKLNLLIFLVLDI